MPFLGIGMKTDTFQSCGFCWVFQFCWHIEGSTFTASSFRIWNSSTGNPSPPLALLVVLLPKAHLTSHCRMSGSRWVITPSWLSGSWRPFVYSSSVYSCHLFLISSASVRPTGVSSLSLLRGIFPTQKSNPGLPHCGRVLYQLKHQRSPRIPKWVACPFSMGSSQPGNRTRVSLISGGFFFFFFHQLSSQWSPSLWKNSKTNLRG